MNVFANGRVNRAISCQIFAQQLYSLGGAGVSALGHGTVVRPAITIAECGMIHEEVR
jgi:hypothetical protein